MIGRDQVNELIKKTDGNDGIALYIIETLPGRGLNLIKYEQLFNSSPNKAISQTGVRLNLSLL